jgi:hypothetical protein
MYKLQNCIVNLNPNFANQIILVDQTYSPSVPSAPQYNALSTRNGNHAHSIKYNIYPNAVTAVLISKNDRWQLYWGCEDLYSEDRTVKSHIQIVSARVGYSWG